MFFGVFWCFFGIFQNTYCFFFFFFGFSKFLVLENVFVQKSKKLLFFFGGF